MVGGSDGVGVGGTAVFVAVSVGSAVAVAGGGIGVSVSMMTVTGINVLVAVAVAVGIDWLSLGDEARGSGSVVLAQPSSDSSSRLTKKLNGKWEMVNGEW